MAIVGSERVLLPTRIARSNDEKPWVYCYLVEPKPMLTKEEFEAGEEGYVWWSHVENKVIFYE